MSGSPDPELERLLEQYEIAVRFNALTEGVTRAINEDEPDYAGARAALLGYIAAQYVRLPPPLTDESAEIEEALGDDYTRQGTAADADRPPASPPGSYKAARGILPWRPGDELPEERIRRLRDAADGNEENADVP